MDQKSRLVSLQAGIFMPKPAEKCKKSPFLGM